MVVRPAVAAAGEVPIDGRGLFRRKLVIQIFPESEQDLLTVHSPYLFAMSVLADGWKENSSAARLVPVAFRLTAERGTSKP